MADDDKGKKDFSDILSNIHRKFEIIHTKWDGECKQFEIKLRTQIPRDNEDFNSLCDEWVDLFSDVTDTVWAKKISNTGPKIRFRKQYQCWTQGGKTVQKELLFDPRRCKATLDMKVLTDNPLSRRKNKHIRMGLNVVVKINFYHLHPVDTTQPFAFFVHNCEPQAEVPKPVAQSSEKLAQLVAAMVQNGPTISQKAAEKAEKCIARLNEHKTKPVVPEPEPLQQQEQALPQLEVLQPLQQPQTQTLIQPLNQSQPQLIVSYGDSSEQLLPDSLESQTVELVQSMPLQSLESVKLEDHHHSDGLEPNCTQFVVSAPQFDVSDHFLLCQQLMFDTSQIIPLSNALPSHFVQVQPPLSNENGPFL
ncbi:hypothetical protein NQ315_004110 [Exocentrus adspersus]|uniref:Uncharacterized protein n=1 Tax=Exocentrus adspersus TaxID=1586481 RepID=A0AAV8W821_9CUCU|nr:hypothetical protein NQ315_004110 [Exocentrus adspersus]